MEDSRKEECPNRSDYDSLGAQRDVNPTPDRYLWTALLNPYIKSDQLWTCPSTRLAGTCGSPVWLGPKTSYGYSFCDNRNSEATIQSPSELLMFLDWRNTSIKWNVNGCACCSSLGC